MAAHAPPGPLPPLIAPGSEVAVVVLMLVYFKFSASITPPPAAGTPTGHPGRKPDTPPYFRSPPLLDLMRSDPALPALPASDAQADAGRGAPCAASALPALLLARRAAASTMWLSF